MKKYEIIKVEWTDAIAYSVKVFIEDFIKEDLPISESCGFLIHEDNEKIIIASMMYENILEQYQVIPKAMIKKITKLKEVKK